MEVCGDALSCGFSQQQYRPLGNMRLSGFDALKDQEITLAATEVLWDGDWTGNEERWILPGFVDAHRHLPHGYEPHDPRDLGAERTAALAAARLQGISNVVDMGVGVLEPWEERPTWLRTALRGIEGATDQPASSPFAAVATNVEDCVRGVEKVAEAGADHVKIFATGTGRYSKDLAVKPKMTKEQIFAAVETATSHDLAVAAHCHGGRALWTCLEAGVASVEHGLYLTRSDLRACADAGVVLTLTLGVYLARHGDRIRHRLRELVHDVLEAGVTFAVGTDTASQTMGQQVALLIELGMPPRTAIAGSVADAADATCMLVYDRDPTARAEVVSVPRGIAMREPLRSFGPAMGRRSR